MNTDRAILSIAMLAAFADGTKDDNEREHVKQFAQQLGASSVELMGVYQDVLLGRITLADAVAALTEEGQRRYAYELAVCVCDSDGVRCETENKFLKDLRTHLGLDGDKAVAAVEQQADAIALAGMAPISLANEATNNTVDDDALNKTILNYAILNGALELLPQSWASVAIIPMQIKMVYRIGKTHGHELDQVHIREFLATVGVGMTSQYLEQFGRKLVGGLLGSFLGKTGKKGGKRPPVWRFLLRQPMRLDNWPNAITLGVAK
jgi:tellurite resistance protein